MRLRIAVVCSRLVCPRRRRRLRVRPSWAWTTWPSRSATWRPRSGSTASCWATRSFSRAWPARRCMVRVNKRQAIVLEPGLPAEVDDRLSHIAFATRTCRRSRRISTRGASSRTAPRPDLWPRGAARAGSGWQRRGVRAGGGDCGVAADLAVRAAVDAAVSHRRRRARRGEGARVLPRGARARGDLARRRRPGAHQLGEHARARRHRLRRVHAQRQAAHAPAAGLAAPRVPCSCPTCRRPGKPSAPARPPPPAPALQKPRIGRNNKWQLNLFDKDGTRVELMEPLPTRIPN